MKKLICALIGASALVASATTYIQTSSTGTAPWKPVKDSVSQAHLADSARHAPPSAYADSSRASGLADSAKRAGWAPLDTGRVRGIVGDTATTLRSNMAGYLPLIGGTLTGFLTGTSAELWTNVNAHDIGPALTLHGSVYTCDANLLLRSSSGYGNCVGFSDQSKPVGFQRWNLGVENDIFQIQANSDDRLGGESALKLDRNGNLTILGKLTASSFTGNTSTATKLQTARTIATSGDVTGTPTNFDGTANITIPTTLPTLLTAGSAGSATSVPTLTWDAKGRLTAVESAAITASGLGALTTVTGDVTSRAANTVYAAPDGSAGTATFRRLTYSDVPGATWLLGNLDPNGFTIPQANVNAIGWNRAAGNGEFDFITNRTNLAGGFNWYSVLNGVWSTAMTLSSYGSLYATTSLSSPTIYEGGTALSSKYLGIGASILHSQISDWGAYINQPLLTTSSPTFGTVTANGGITGNLTGHASLDIPLTGSSAITGPLVSSSTATFMSSAQAPISISGWSGLSGKTFIGNVNESAANGLVFFSNALQVHGVNGIDIKAGGVAGMSFSPTNIVAYLPVSFNGLITANGGLQTTTYADFGSTYYPWGTVFANVITNAPPADASHFSLGGTTLTLYKYVSQGNTFTSTIEGTGSGLLLSSTAISGTFTPAVIVPSRAVTIDATYQGKTVVAGSYALNLPSTGPYTGFWFYLVYASAGQYRTWGPPSGTTWIFRNTSLTDPTYSVFSGIVSWNGSEWIAG